MKKILLLALCLFCTLPTFAIGIIYQDTIQPVIATDMKTNDIKHLKCGECQVFNCMGLIETGHAGIQKAAVRAGITQIHHVDFKIKRILFWSMGTVQVYGE